MDKTLPADLTESGTLAANINSEDTSVPHMDSTRASADGGAKTSTSQEKVASDLEIPTHVPPGFHTVGEEEAPDTPDPCEDIAGAIEVCLNDVSEFKGSHIYAKAFSEVPNPG
ncbi:hypothetical protein FRC01_003769, partial [Tulasnella sp. 417]